jgi:transketolase
MVRALEAAGRGHMGSAFSLVEMLRVLYDDILRFDPARPRWAERDRMVLSKGHGALALYAILADKGFFPAEEMGRYCRPEGILGGHPEHTKVPGVEASTGSLGHGLPMGMGMAMALRGKARVFVIVGDGECDEGSVWECALHAAKHRLDNLTVLVDYNHLQSYGPTAEVMPLDPLGDKWRAFGFAVTELDGHDLGALRAALGRVPLAPGRPSALICHTVKGKGVPLMEHNPDWHHKNKPSAEEIRILLAALETA